MAYISYITRLTKAPKNWEVLQQENGYCSFDVEGVFEIDENDDTYLEQEFAFDKICLRVINEETGEYVTGLIPVKVSGNGFSATVKNVPVGGSYMLDTFMYDAEKCVAYNVRGERRRHFCVGDVYIIAGQSNAAGMGRGLMREELDSNIHVLRNLEEWDIASQPFCDFDYSKLGMFMSFAKTVSKKAGMPVGLIPAAMGAASIARWIPTQNGDLYRKMMKAVNSVSGVKAVLWYQGCHEAGEGTTVEKYLDSFRNFVSAVRNDTNNPELPVFTFQLNSRKLMQADTELDEGYDCVREAQRRAGKDKNVYVLATLDASSHADFIHNSAGSNVMLGERLGVMVLKELYNIGLGVYSPEVISAKMSKDKKSIEVTLSNILEHISTLNAKPEEFPIVVRDEDGMRRISDYTVNFDKITMKFDSELKGKTTISGECGADPKNIIMDFGSQLAMLGFLNMEVEI